VTVEQNLTEDDFRQKLSGLRNWNRWGADDQRGAVNLITQDSVRQAAQLVQLGQTVSMCRPFPKTPAANNLNPAQHFMRRRFRGDGTSGSAVDYIAINYHGQASTHLDALCHVWNRDGMWNGRNPDDEVTYDGVTWGGVEHWADGIVGRGVLLDVAEGRSKGYVDLAEPVTADELRGVATATGVQLEPGDILVIHSGRDAWERARKRLWGAPDSDGSEDRPGLHASCLEFFHEVDCSLIIWDMMDAKPNDYGVPHTTHAALFNQGVGLLDNALLEPLALACRQQRRSTFMVAVAPLKIIGGTGSPVNPLAIL
jgi:kynurenine formamidase